MPYMYSFRECIYGIFHPYYFKPNLKYVSREVAGYLPPYGSSRAPASLRGFAAEGLTNQSFLLTYLMRKNISLHMEEAVNKMDRLNGEIRFTREEQLYVCEHFEPVKLQKNEFLIREGEIEQYFYFMESGILRYWSTDGPEREITIRFITEGEFAGSYLSLRRQEPSHFHIQAIEPSVVWRIRWRQLAEIYSWSLNFNKALRFFFEDIHCRQTNRDICLLRLSAEERYRYILKQEKEILLSIPLKYIASYIGIAPQTLSRVRRSTT